MDAGLVRGADGRAVYLKLFLERASFTEFLSFSLALSEEYSTHGK